MKYRTESILDLEIVEYRLVVVLCCQTGVRKILPNFRPALKTAIIKHLQVVRNDERYDTVSQTLLEYYEPSHTPVAVLKRVDHLKALVQIEDILQRFLPLGIVLDKQRFYLLANVLGCGRFVTSYLVGQAFVGADGKPLLAAV